MDTLTFPNELEMNMKRFSASVVFTLAYGKRLDNDNKDLYAVLDILDGFIRDCYPGAHLVDAFPILDLLPDVLAPWRAIARQKHEREVEVILIIFANLYSLTTFMLLALRTTLTRSEK